MNIEKRETYHLLKEGPNFRRRLLNEATSMDKGIVQKMSDLYFALALQEFKKWAGVKT